MKEILHGIDDVLTLFYCEKSFNYDVGGLEILFFRKQTKREKPYTLCVWIGSHLQEILNDFSVAFYGGKMHWRLNNLQYESQNTCKTNQLRANHKS